MVWGYGCQREPSNQGVGVVVHGDLMGRSIFVCDIRRYAKPLAAFPHIAVLSSRNAAIGMPFFCRCVGFCAERRGYGIGACLMRFCDAVL